MNKVSNELARFLTSSKHFNPAQQRVTHNAFMPRAGAASVFRVGGLNDARVRAIGKEHIVLGPGRRIHGCGYIGGEHVTRSGLSLEVDNTPPRHANIVGWPPEKGAQKLKAMELAHAAILCLWGDSDSDMAT